MLDEVFSRRYSINIHVSFVHPPCRSPIAVTMSEGLPPGNIVIRHGRAVTTRSRRRRDHRKAVCSEGVPAGVSGDPGPPRASRDTVSAGI